MVYVICFEMLKNEVLKYLISHYIFNITINSKHLLAKKKKILNIDHRSSSVSWHKGTLVNFGHKNLSMLYSTSKLFTFMQLEKFKQKRIQ